MRIILYEVNYTIIDVQWPALITCSDHMLTICLLSDSEAYCTFMGALQRGPSGQRRGRPRPPKILVG